MFIENKGFVISVGYNIHLLISINCLVNYCTFLILIKILNVCAGRCARAGREGHAYSLVASDETCYLLDLLLFLGRPLNIIESNIESKLEDAVGCIPRSLVEEELSRILQLHETNSDLVIVEKIYLFFHF